MVLGMFVSVDMYNGVVVGVVEWIDLVVCDGSV